MCSLTKVLNLVPDSALFPAPSLGFVTVVTSSACLFVIMWAASLSLLLPIQNAAAHDIHYLFQLQYIQEKVAENISQPTFFFFFSLFSSPSSSSCPQSGLGISSVACSALSGELLYAFSEVSPCIRQENPTDSSEITLLWLASKNPSLEDLFAV